MKTKIVVVTQEKYNAVAKELALYKEKEKAWLETYGKMKDTSLRQETYIMLQTLAAGSIAYRLVGGVLNPEAIPKPIFKCACVRGDTSEKICECYKAGYTAGAKDFEMGK